MSQHSAEQRFEVADLVRTIRAAQPFTRDRIQESVVLKARGTVPSSPRAVERAYRDVLASLGYRFAEYRGLSRVRGIEDRGKTIPLFVPRVHQESGHSARTSLRQSMVLERVMQYLRMKGFGRVFQKVAIGLDLLAAAKWINPDPQAWPDDILWLSLAAASGGEVPDIGARACVLRSPAGAPCLVLSCCSDTISLPLFVAADISTTHEIVHYYLEKTCFAIPLDSDAGRILAACATVKPFLLTLLEECFAVADTAGILFPTESIPGRLVPDVGAVPVGPLRTPLRNPAAEFARETSVARAPLDALIRVLPWVYALKLRSEPVPASLAWPTPQLASLSDALWPHFRSMYVAAELLPKPLLKSVTALYDSEALNWIVADRDLGALGRSMAHLAGQ